MKFNTSAEMTKRPVRRCEAFVVRFLFIYNQNEIIQRKIEILHMGLFLTQIKTLQTNV